MSKLTIAIDRYLSTLNPLVDASLCTLLRDSKTQELVHKGVIAEIADYNTVGMHLMSKVCGSAAGFTAFGAALEHRDKRLADFYCHHGLDILNEKDLNGPRILAQINQAVELLQLSDHHGTCTLLIRAIQIVREEKPEFDVSYSHPKIPFTIFVSVGENRTATGSLRLAESILHEAMHLKLTLIEENTVLVSDNTTNHYSPWRETDRPVRGVMHAVYVFRTILEWYQRIKVHFKEFKDRDFINWRIECITNELLETRTIITSPGFSPQGKAFLSLLLDQVDPA